MAKSSKDANKADGQGNLLLYFPENLTLVTDESSPLYDKRVHEAFDEAMVLNIMAFGVIEPIVVVKNTETGNIEVAAGRRRVINALEANKRLVAVGAEQRKVPATVRSGKAHVLAGIMVSENEQRLDESPMARAEKMQRMLDHNASEEDVLTAFGCSRQTMKTMLALLGSPAAVRNAIDSGKIGIKHAKALVGMEPEAQREKVRELIEAGDGATGHERARKQRAVVNAGPTMRGKKEIVAKRDESPEGSDCRAVLDWVLGIA